MNAITITSKKWGKRLGWGLLVLVLLLYIGLPAGMGLAAVWPGGSEVGAPPPGFAEITLTAADGVALHAWQRAAQNGATILVIHGAGGSREDVRQAAEMLARHGYGVLALDLRGHGESGGRTNRFGWQSSADVAAAAAYLQADSPEDVLGGLGLSLGGETLLGAAGQYPALRAIAADGASHRSTAELLALESERPLVRNFTARVLYAAVGLFSGQRPPQPLLDSMQAAQDTRFLLIAAGGNTQETEFNRLFARVLGDRAELWVVPEVGHLGAYSRSPQEYEQRVTGFFDRTLLNKTN